MSSSSLPSSGSSSTSSTRLRVLPLPSEHWQELTDLWICHSDQTLSAPLAAVWQQARGDHVLCPPPRTVYAGVTTLLLHPWLIDHGSVLVRMEDEVAIKSDLVDEDQPASSSSSFRLPTSIQAPETPPHIPDFHSSDHHHHSSSCSRASSKSEAHCGDGASSSCSHGSVPFAKSASSNHQSALSKDEWRSLICSDCRSSVGQILLAIPTGLDPSVPISALAIKLFKDKVASSGQTTSEPESTSLQASPSNLNIWGRYLLEQRLAFDLFSASKAHGRFRFVLRPQLQYECIKRIHASSDASGSFASSSSSSAELSASQSPPQLPLFIVISLMNLDGRISSSTIPLCLRRGKLSNHSVGVDDGLESTQSCSFLFVCFSI